MTKKILVIEDDPDHIAALHDALSFALGDAVQLLTASNGEEGVKMAEREHPDLITLDVILPQMDGVDTLRALRANEALKETPVIMLTNMEHHELMTKLESLGISRHIVKVDTSPQEMAEIVKEELGL